MIGPKQAATGAQKPWRMRQAEKRTGNAEGKEEEKGLSRWGLRARRRTSSQSLSLGQGVAAPAPNLRLLGLQGLRMGKMLQLLWLLAPALARQAAGGIPVLGQWLPGCSCCNHLVGLARRGEDGLPTAGAPAVARRGGGDGGGRSGSWAGPRAGIAALLLRLLLLVVLLRLLCLLHGCWAGLRGK